MSSQQTLPHSQTTDLYHETILDEYAHPHNVGTLEDADIVHQELHASCGDDVTVSLKFDDITRPSSEQHITKIAWQGNGCAISLATMSLLSQHVTGMTIAAVQAISQQDLEALIGISEISPGRQKCLLLGLRAVQHAIALAKGNL